MDITKIKLQLQEDGYSEEEIQTIVEELESQAKPDDILNAIVAKEPAKIGDAFNDIVKNRLSLIVEEYKARLLTGDNVEEEDELEEEIEDEDFEFEEELDDNDLNEADKGYFSKKKN